MAVDETGPDPAARVRLQIGMHCGPVSASVVGTQVCARARARACDGCMVEAECNLSRVIAIYIIYSIVYILL